MDTLFFRQNGKFRFVAISPEIDEQIRVFTKKANISRQEMAVLIYEQFGIVSETSIIRYFKYWTDSNKCPRCYGIGKIIDEKTIELIVCPQCEGKSVQNTTKGGESHVR